MKKYSLSLIAPAAVVVFFALPFSILGCSSSSPAASTVQTAVVSGTSLLSDGTPVSGQAVEMRLTLNGANLFTPGANGCVQGDPHMPATITQSVVPDANGHYTMTLSLMQAVSVTQPGCTVETINATTLSTLRLDAQLPADPTTCPPFCSAQGSAAAANCVSDCEAGQRIIEASATLTQLDTANLISQSQSGTLHWTVPLTFLEIGPPISAGVGPDLQVDAQAAAASWHITQETFAPTDCAMVEQCVGAPGLRTLLRFDGNIENTGSSDLVLGNPVNNPLFEYSACHNHYHLKNMMLYELLTSDTQQAVVVNGAGVIGRKQGFCVMDMIQIETSSPSNGYNCDNQGLTTGWEDSYDSTLDCQWLDITGVPSGDYILRITVNPDGIFPEVNTANNSAEVPVTIP